MNISFFSIERTYNKFPCTRPETFVITPRSIIHATTFLILSIVNLCANLFLFTILIYSWKTLFHKDFIYKFILTMAIIACSNAIVHFAMTIPCTYMGCLAYSERVMQFLTCLWETLEFGFFWTVFFIAIDRFMMFFCQDYVGYFHKARLKCKPS